MKIIIPEAIRLLAEARQLEREGTDTRAAQAPLIEQLSRAERPAAKGENHERT